MRRIYSLGFQAAGGTSSGSAPVPDDWTYRNVLCGGDTSKVALMMNALSAICSGFAIMFLFWTITHLARKVFISRNETGSEHIPAILGSGIIGALAYTFSDTFWFSAVEGELYALSSLVTGLVFWGMLKWEEEADKPYSGRWIILIAYIMGLGLGIHRLNLLVLPVLVFVFYFRKYEVTTKGVIKALVVAIVMLWLMVFVLIPGVPKVAGWFELLFVNVFGLPYNTGLLFFILVLAGIACFWHHVFNKKRKGYPELYDYCHNCDHDRIFIICHDYDQIICTPADEPE